MLPKHGEVLGGVRSGAPAGVHPRAPQGLMHGAQRPCRASSEEPGLCQSLCLWQGPRLLSVSVSRWPRAPGTSSAAASGEKLGVGSDIPAEPVGRPGPWFPQATPSPKAGVRRCPRKEMPHILGRLRSDSGHRALVSALHPTEPLQERGETQLLWERHPPWETATPSHMSCRRLRTLWLGSSLGVPPCWGI